MIATIHTDFLTTGDTYTELVFAHRAMAVVTLLLTANIRKIVPSMKGIL